GHGAFDKGAAKIVAGEDQAARLAGLLGEGFEPPEVADFKFGYGLCPAIDLAAGYVRPHIVSRPSLAKVCQQAVDDGRVIPAIQLLAGWARRRQHQRVLASWHHVWALGRLDAGRCQGLHLPAWEEYGI